MTPDQIKAELAELAKWQVVISGRDLAEIQRTLVLVLHGVELVLNPSGKRSTDSPESIARQMIVNALGAHKLLAGLVAAVGQEFPDHLAYKIPSKLAELVERAQRDVGNRRKPSAN